MLNNLEHVGGVILAGGLSRRMGGGDKCLKLLGGKTLLSRIIGRVNPQISNLILNINGDPQRFLDYKLPMVNDVIGDFAGPLAGILTGMEWMSKNCPKVRWLATFPADAPFIPQDFVLKCLEAQNRTGTEIVCAKSAGRTHPVCGLWNVGLAQELRAAMEEKKVRKIDQWSSSYSLYYQEFATDPIDPFFNINSEKDLLIAESAYQIGS